MTSLQIFATIVGVPAAFFASLLGLARVGEYVLRAFHNEHVAPAMADVSHAIEKNTDATMAVANALAKAEETQRQDQTDTRATFDRMGQIIEDHEERITALEPTPAKPATIRSRKRS